MVYPLGLEPKLDGVGGRNVIQLHYEYVLIFIQHFCINIIFKLKIYLLELFCRKIQYYPLGCILGCIFYFA